MLIRLTKNKPDFLALSTDDKSNLEVTVGSVLFETDTKKEYVFDGENWVVKQKYPHALEHKWLSEDIEAGGHLGSYIDCEDYDTITVYAHSDANAEVSIRMTNKDETDYSWDYLGTINTASPSASAQANITGVPKVYVAVVNNTESLITTNLYVYLGRK